MFSRTESFQQFIRLYPTVTAIILLHLLLYLVTDMPIFSSRLVFEMLAGVNLYIAEGELWRFVTPIFIHSGFAHMLFNSFSLVLLGPALERMLGSMRFLLVYVAGGTLANVVTFFIYPLTYTHVGSSGSIFALFGFYLAIIAFKKHMLSQQNSQIVISITVIGLIMTFLQPNINIAAHIFGLISGFLIGAIAYYPNRTTSFNKPTAGGFKITKFSFPKITIGAVSPIKLLLWGLIALLAILGILNQ